MLCGDAWSRLGATGEGDDGGGGEWKLLETCVLYFAFGPTIRDLGWIDGTVPPSSSHVVHPVVFCQRDAVVGPFCDPLPLSRRETHRVGSKAGGGEGCVEGNETTLLGVWF